MKLQDRTRSPPQTPDCGNLASCGECCAPWVRKSIAAKGPATHAIPAAAPVRKHRSKESRKCPAARPPPHAITNDSRIAPLAFRYRVRVNTSLFAEGHPGGKFVKPHTPGRLAASFVKMAATRREPAAQGKRTHNPSGRFVTGAMQSAFLWGREASSLTRFAGAAMKASLRLRRPESEYLCCTIFLLSLVLLLPNLPSNPIQEETHANRDKRELKGA